MLRKLLWLLKQLFPLWYVSYYANENGKWVEVAKIHFGKVKEAYKVPRHCWGKKS